MPNQLKKDSETQNYTLEPRKDDTKEQEKQKENEIPHYMIRLDYDEEQIKRLKEEIFAEFKALQDERAKKQIESKMDSLDRQYEGEVDNNPDCQFNLHVPITKIKINKIVNRMLKAILESNPVFSFTPRPEFSKTIGLEICEKQQDFIDYKIDSIIPFESPIRKVAHSAVLKFGGILKIFHDVKREKKRREETYEGTLIPVVDQQGQPIVNEYGQPQYDITQNDGLREFLSTYPDAQERYPGYVKKLLEGKKIEIVANFEETIYNDPRLKYIDFKNFYARQMTEGYSGLCNTLLIVERQEYTWWELIQEERKGNFKNIHKLRSDKKEEDSEEERKGYKQETYKILECTYYFKENESDEEEKKIVCWFEEEKKEFLGAMNYPYYGFDCNYIPFYVTDIEEGLFKKGPGNDLTDSNIAVNAILNFLLEGAWIKNTVTPIAPVGSPVHNQFMEKRFTHGISIESDPKAIDFLNRYIGQIDIPGLLNILQYVIKFDDDVTGVSSLTTGRADPIDPRAPATKTLALLQESGENIETYLKVFLSSFNKIAEILLAMYHQISQVSEESGLKYTPKVTKVVGGDPFATITRSELIAKTNVQSQALSFNFDKINEKKENLALLSMIRQDPLFMRYPEGVWLVLKTVIKSWSPMWRNIIDKVLPPLEQFKAEQQKMAVQAVHSYVTQIVRKAKLYNIPPEFDPNALMQTIQQITQEAVTPPSKEVMAEREKAMKG